MNNLFRIKSNDLMARCLSEHTSRPYSNIGMHLVLISGRTVSADARLQSLSNIAFAERYKELSYR